MVATLVTSLSRTVSPIVRKGQRATLRRAPKPSVLAMSLAALFGAAAVPAHAGGIVTTGQTATQLQVNGSVTNITTGTIKGGTALNAFSTFDVDHGKTANLVVPDNAKHLLNLVYDAPVNVNGTVNSLKNGRVGGNVIFADPHGMIVGSGGVLNVGSLTVVTPTRQFMDGVIDVKGNVSELAVSQLIKGQVEHSSDGVIHIDGAINALEKISLQGAKVAVAGKLKAGPDVLHEAAFYGSVNAANVQQAAGMVEHNGEIEIVADTSATIAGTLDVSRRQGAGTGGKVGVMAADVQLSGTARIDASGTDGGGQVSVGMRQAGGAVVHASVTQMDAGALVGADAIGKGDGGTVTVWGDASNHVHGDISARGGSTGGNGGQVEVSARQGLQITGKVDTSAQAGLAGTLLIDPDNLQIVDGSAGSSTDSTVTVGWLQSQGDTNIVLSADNTLTVGNSSSGAAAHVDLSTTLLSHANSLTLKGNDVVVNAGSTILTGGGSVVLDGASINVGAGALIDTVTAATAGRTAGDITLNAHNTAQITTDVLALVSADATIDVYGTLKGNNVNLTADASASNSNVDPTITGVYNEVQTGGTSINNYLPASLLFNSASIGIAAAEATASVVIHSGATVSALGDLNMDAHATQSSSLLYAVGGQDDATITAALMYSGLAGGATTQIASGATVNVGGDLMVKSTDDSTLKADIRTVSSDGKAGITALIGFTKLNVAASIDQGATVNVGTGSNVSVVARNNGNYSLASESDSGDQATATAGIAVALDFLDSNVTANIGANIGTASKLAGNILVQAENLVANNTLSAITNTAVQPNTTSKSAAKLSAVNSVSLYSFISGLVGEKSADADADSGDSESNNSPLTVGAALALGMNNLGASASIGNGAKLYSSGNVGVIAHVSDVGIHNAASSEAPSASSAGDDPSSTGTISAGVALGFYNHTAQATVGADSVIQGGHIAVDSNVDVPFTIPLAAQISGFTWGDWSDEESLMLAVGKLGSNPTGALTSYSDATGGATDGALSGSVSYLDIANNSTAWIGQNATLTSTGSSDAYLLSLQSDAVDENGVPLLPTINYGKAVTVSASSSVQTITDAGNMATLAGLPVKIGTSGGNVSVGGAADVVEYANNTLAGVDDGVTITTAANTGVNVLANSSDFSIAVSPSSGGGAPIGVNGTVGLTSYDNQTHAVVSNLATIHSSSLNVDAEEHVSAWTVAGALVSSSKAAVGAGIAVNDIEADTGASVGAISAVWRPAGMASGVALSNTAGISAGTVTVDGVSEGQIFALAVAGSKSSASQDDPDAPPDDSGSDPDATSSASPSFLSTLLGKATAASNVIGGEAQTVMNTLTALKNLAAKISAASPSSGPSKDKPPAPDKEQEAAFGLAISGAAAVNTSALSTAATIDGASITTPTLQVLAQNDSNLIAASGSAALVSAGVPGGDSSSGAIAGAVAINIEDNSTTAGVSNSIVSNASNVTIKALASGEHLSIGIGAGVNTKKEDAVDVAGSVSLALIENNTSAYARQSTFNGNTATTGNGMTVMAYDQTETGLGGGALALGGDTGVGLALTYASSASTVSATLDDATVQSFNSLSVLALDPTLLMSGAMEAAANKSATGDADGGSFVFNDIGNTVSASIGGGSSITLGGALQVLASDDPLGEGLTSTSLAGHDVEANGQELFDFNKSLLAGQSAPQGAAVYGVAGAVEVSKSVVGIAFVDNAIHNSHKASIAGATVSANTASVVASDRASILGIAAGLGVSTEDGGFAGIGSANVNSLDNTTTAQVGDTATGVAATSLTTNGTAANAVTIAANNSGSLFSVAGSVAGSLSESPSVGLAVAYDSDTSDTEAGIHKATVTATGSGAQVQASSTHAIEAIAASVAATGGDLALAGSFSINEISDYTRALVDNGSTVNGSLSVNAGDSAGGNNASISSLAGGVALSGGVSVGAGVSVNQISSDYQAGVADSTVNLAGAGALQVSATDAASIYTAALGGAVGSDVAAGISTTVNTIGDDVSGQIDNATVNSTGSAATTRVAISATDNAIIQALSGGLGIATSGAGFGVGVATNKIDNVVSAAMHSGSANVGDVVISAQSGAEIDSLALGAALGTDIASAAGSVAVNLIGTTVGAVIDNAGTGGANASVSAQNNVGVLAANSDAVKSIAGAASLGVGDVNLSVGASTAVNEIDGSTTASISHAAVDALGNGTGLSVNDGTLANPAFDADLSQTQGYTAPTAGDNTLSGFMSPTLAANTKLVHGVAVNAASKRTLSSVAATGSVNINPDPLDPSVAVSATVTVNQVGGSTTASITNATVNQRAGTPANSQAVDVTASSHAYSESVVGALSGALWGGAGAAIDTETNTLQTTAQIVDSTVKAAGGVRVDARSTAGVSALAAGFSAGGLGLIGTGEDVTFTGSTIAAVDGDTLNADHLDVDANSANRVRLMAGGVAGGSIGMAGSYAVLDAGQQTIARIGRSTAGNASAVTLAHDANVQAGSTTDSTINAASAALAGGSGLGMAASVGLVQNTTTASIENGSSVTAGGKVALNATDGGTLSLAGGALGASLGSGVGAGATAAVSIVRSKVLAQIDSATVQGAGVTLAASNTQNVSQNVVAVGVGGSAGLAGTVSVIMLGQGNDTGTDSNTSGASDLLAKVNTFSSGNKLGNTDGALTSDEQSGIAGATQHGIGGNLLAGAAGGTNGSVAITSGDANSAHAYISGSSKVTTTLGGDLDLTGTATTTTANNVGALGAGGALGIGVAVGITHIYNDVGAVAGPNTQVTVAGALNATATAQDGSGHAIDDKIVAGALAAGIGAAVNVGDERISDQVIADVGGIAAVTGQMAVRATDTSSIVAANDNVSLGGLAGVGVVVLDAEKSGTVWAAVNADNATSAVGASNILLAASSSGIVSTSTYAATGGVGASLGANSASSTDSVGVTASIGDNTFVDVYGGVAVTATRTPQAIAAGYGVGVADDLQVGATVAAAHVSGNTLAQVGNNVVFAGIGKDANNNMLFGTLAVTASNLVSAAGYSASADAFASGGGILIGLNGAGATADNSSSVTAQVLNNVVLPMSDVTIAAHENSVQTANASGISIGLGLAGIGVDYASADSNTTTNAHLGSGAISAILVDANKNALAVRGGILSITADGADDNTAAAQAGAGGLVAGAAAVASTQNEGTTTADIAGGASLYAVTLSTSDVLTKVLLSNGVASPFMTGDLTLSASHTSQFFSKSDATQASIAGASGAVSRGDVDYNVNAAIGSNVNLQSSDINIDALNAVTQLSPDYSAQGISGGALAGSGVSSSNTITTQSNASVGANTELDVTGDPLGADHGRFSLIAGTQIAATDRTTDTAGGAIAGLTSDSSTKVSASNTVTIGNGATLDSIGDMDIGTYSLVNVSNDSYGHGYGLAGGAGGSAVSDITSNQNINIGTDDTLTAWGNLSIATGRGDQATYQNSLIANASNRVYFDGAFNGTDPYGEAIIVNNGTLTVGTGSQLDSVRDILLGTLAGVSQATAVGEGHYTLLGIPLTNDDPNSSNTGTQSVAFNGTAVAGTRHLATLNIDANGNVSASNVDYTSLGAYQPVGQLVDQISRLTALKAQTSDPQTQTDIQGSIDALTALSNTLQGRNLTPTTTVQAVEVSDTLAAGGNIEVNTGNFSGSGSMTAYGGPEISLTNASTKFLVVDQLLIPNELGGNIKFTGSGKGSAAFMASNVHQVNANAAASIQISNTYDTSHNGGTAPAIFLTDTLENRGGSLYIFNQSGDLGQFGAVSVNQQTILLPNGAYIVDTPDAGKFLGGSPDTEFIASNGTIYQLTYNQGFNSSMQGTALPVTADEAVTYVANYLAPTYGCAATGTAASFGACLAGNPSSGGGNNQTGSGVMFFYPGNLFTSDPNSTSTAQYVAQYGNDTAFYDGRYVYPSVGVRTLTNTIATLAPQNAKTSVTKVGQAAVINAKFIDMNGTLQVGLDSDFSASITPVTINTGIDSSGHVIQRDLIACIDDVACRPYAAAYKGSDGLYKYPGDAVVTSDNTLIGVYYNPATKQLVLDDVSGGGSGSVTLQGAIINTNPTGGNNISVSDGYAHVTVRNTTGTTLLTSDINTGDGNVGVVKITDTLKTDSSGRALTTWYVYKLGEGTSTYTSSTATDFAGLTAQSSTTGNSAVYNPLAGERYWWNYDADLTRSRNGDSFFNTYTDWSFTQLPSNTANTYGNIWSITSGLSNDSSLENIAFQESISGTANTFTQHVHETYSDKGPMTWDWWVPTAVHITAANSVKADNPINISFTGTNASGLVDVSSNSSIVVGGNIQNIAGATKITATGAGSTITSNSNGSINTQSLVLNADSGIGNIGTPMTVSLSNPAGAAAGLNTVTAVTRTGNIGLAFDGADAILKQIKTDANSDVLLHAFGNLVNGAAANTAAVTGRNLTFISDNGNIGTLATPITVDALSTTAASGVVSGGVINATAFGDIGLKQLGGDMYIGHVASSNGDVKLDAGSGSMLDGRNIDTTDQTANLAAVWDGLNLLDTRTGADQNDATKSAAYAAVVIPYQNGVNSEYRSYWTLVALGTVSADGKTFTPSPAGTAALQAQADGAGMTVAAYAQLRYDTLQGDLQTALGSVKPDWQGTYDSSFAFTASAAQIAAMTRGQYWTSDALLYSINDAALKPASSAATLVTDTNVSGNHVTLIAANASIGKLADSVSFDLSSGGLSNLTQAQKAALASANSAGDVINQVYTRNGSVDASCTSADTDCQLVSFDIKQTSPLFVGVLGGLTAQAADDIYIQAKDSLPIASLTAGHDIHVSAMSGMTNAAAAGADAITTGNDLVLTNGSGSVGSAAKALSLNIGGVLESARSGDANGVGDMYLSTLHGDLSFLDLFASRLLSLSTFDTAAGKGNVYSRNVIGGVGVTAIAAQYLVFNTTGSVYGIDPTQALLVDLGDSSQPGAVSGTVGGNAFLRSDSLLDIGHQAVGAVGDAGYLAADDLHVKGYLHLNSTAPGIAFDGSATQIDGKLTIDNTTSVGFNAASVLNVNGDMDIEANSISMQAGSRAHTAQRANWQVDGGDMSVAYLDGANVDLDATTGKILGVDGSPVDQGENIHTTGVLTLNGGAGGVRTDGGGIGADTDHRLLVAAGTIDSADAQGDTYLGLRGSADIAVHNVAAVSSNGNIDVASPIDFVATQLASDIGSFSATDADTGGDILLSTTGSALMTLDNITAGRDLWLTTVDGGVATGASSHVTVTRDLHVLMTGAGVMSDSSASGISAGRDIDMNASALLLNNVQAQRNLSLTARTGDVNYRNLTAVTGDVTAMAAGDIIGMVGGAMDAGNSVQLTATGVTLPNVQATLGDIGITATGNASYETLNAGGDVSSDVTGALTGGAASTLVAGGNADLHAGSMSVNDVTATGDVGLTSTTGGIAGTGTIQSQQGKATLVAATGISLAQVYALGNIGATAGTDISIATLQAGDAAHTAKLALQAGGDASVTQATVWGDATGNSHDLMLGDATIHGTADLTASGTMTVTKMSADGDATLTASDITVGKLDGGANVALVTTAGDAGYTTITAADDLTATIAGALNGATGSLLQAGGKVLAQAASMNLGRVVAGADADLTSTSGSMVAGQVQSTGNLLLNSAVDATLGTVAVGGASSVTTAGNTAVTQLQSTGAATLTVGGDLSVATLQIGDAAHTASLTTQANGTVSLGQGAVWGDAASNSQDLALTDIDVHGQAGLNASDAITVARLSVGQDATLSAARMTLNSLTGGGRVSLDATGGDVGYGSIGAAGDLIARVAGALDSTSAGVLQAGGSVDAQAASMSVDQIVAGTDAKLDSVSGSISANRLQTGGDLLLASAADTGVGVVSTGGTAGVSAAGSAHIAQLSSTGAMQYAAGTDAAIDSLQVGDAAHASSLTAQAGGALNLGSGDVWGDLDGSSRTLSIGTVHVHGLGKLAAAGDLAAGTLLVDGNLAAQAGGQMTLGTATIGGDANLSAAGMTLGTVDTGGNLTLQAVAGDVDYLNLRAGGNLGATLAGTWQATGAGVFSAVNDVTVRASQIVFDQGQAGHDMTLTANNDIRGNSLVSGNDMTIANDGFTEIGTLSAGNALRLQSLSGVGLHIVSANSLDLATRGNVDLDSLVVSKSLTIQANSLNAHVTQGGKQGLTMDISGYQNEAPNADARASSVNLFVDAPSGLDFTRLWADNASITSTAQHNGIVNGAITHVLTLDTPRGRILMNNDDITSMRKMAVQLYEPHASFTMIQDGRYFYTSALVTQFGFNNRDSTDNYTSGRHYMPITVYDTSAEREIVSLAQILKAGPPPTSKSRQDALPRPHRPVVNGGNGEGSLHGVDFGIVNTTMKVSMAQPQ